MVAEKEAIGKESITHRRSDGLFKYPPHDHWTVMTQLFFIVGTTFMAEIDKQSTTV